MIIAILDLGTNTFNLLVSEVLTDGRYKIIHESKLPVKLGKGGINKKIIAQDAIKRAMDALKAHHRDYMAYNPDIIIGYATSGIRSAKNGQQLIDQIKSTYDIDIHVIDGNREAELIFKGIMLSLELSDNEVLIVDIGGGSIEFIIGNSKGINWKKSYNMGAARLVERFYPSDPITENEINNIVDYFENNLTDLFEIIGKRKINTLVGAAGTFDTLADILIDEGYITYSKKPHNILKVELLDYLHNAFIKSTFEERLKIKGLPEYRAEYIVLAGIFVNFVVKKLKIKQVIHSEYSLKEGVLAEFLENIN